MSKGSPVIPLRVPPEVLALVDGAVERSQTARRAGGWSRSSFILEAITEKLAKMKRSRTWRKKKAELVEAKGEGTIR
jgi:hypothetical protein